jgi:multicomponent Na+:H+ antiporter subunit D
MSSPLLPLLILIPLTGAVLAFLIRPVAKAWVGLTTAVVTSGLTLALLLSMAAHGVHAYIIGGWEAPLGIHLRADGLSAMHLMMTALAGVLISFYARTYFNLKQSSRQAELFWPLWLFLWGGLNALYIAADLFNIYVLLEVMGLSAVGLLVLSGQRQVVIAGLRYLLSAMAGSMLYLLGVAFLYAEHSSLDIELLAGLITAGPVASVAFALMLIGLLLKTALFPLHFWLPPAHSSATAPVSAILSALVVKASFYLLIRLWFSVFDQVHTLATGMLLGLFGAGAILWGSIQALRQTRLKMLIAYSTVAQLGYLFFIFPVSASMTQNDAGTMAPWLIEAGKGSIYHGLSHALSKASIFLSAGILMYAAGRDELSKMRGLADRMPLTVFAMALAGVNLMGLPPSGGFIAKWLTMHAVLGVGQWWWAPVIVGGGLMTAGYMFMLLRPAFLPGDADSPLKPVPRSMEVIALLMALGSLLIGLRAAEFLDLLMIGSPFTPLTQAVGGLP